MTKPNLNHLTAGGKSAVRLTFKLGLDKSTYLTVSLDGFVIAL